MAGVFCFMVTDSVTSSVCTDGCYLPIAEALDLTDHPCAEIGRADPTCAEGLLPRPWLLLNRVCTGCDSDASPLTRLQAIMRRSTILPRLNVILHNNSRLWEKVAWKTAFPPQFLRLCERQSCCIKWKKHRNVPGGVLLAVGAIARAECCFVSKSRR